MSWNSINDLWNFEHSLRIKEGEFYLDWTCPRCGYHNKTKMMDEHGTYKFGYQIKCKNTEVCGQDQVILELNFNISGRHKGLNDRPLNQK